MVDLLFPTGDELDTHSIGYFKRFVKEFQDFYVGFSQDVEKARKSGLLRG